MIKALLDQDGNIVALPINPAPYLAAQCSDLADDDPRVVAFKDSLNVVIPPVTKRQILVWMYQNLNKIESDIIAAIESLDDPVALITWNYPDGPFERSNPLFDELAPIFGMTSEQVDAAFVAAAAL